MLSDENIETIQKAWNELERLVFSGCVSHENAVKMTAQMCIILGVYESSEDEE